MVFTGMSGAENGVRGRVYGLDAKTGREVWRFYTIPGPVQVGGDSWPSPSDPDPIKRESLSRGGGTVWQAPAIDPELGMVYFSTGNAGPDNDGSVRPVTICSPRRSWAWTTRPASTNGTSRKPTTTSGTSTCPVRSCCSTRRTTA